MHHGKCVTRVPWCMPGPLPCGFLWSRWRGKVSGIPGACATRNFAYLVIAPSRSPSFLTRRNFGYLCNQKWWWIQICSLFPRNNSTWKCWHFINSVFIIWSQTQLYMGGRYHQCTSNIYFTGPLGVHCRTRQIHYTVATYLSLYVSRCMRRNDNINIYTSLQMTVRFS